MRNNCCSSSARYVLPAAFLIFLHHGFFFVFFVLIFLFFFFSGLTCFVFSYTPVTGTLAFHLPYLDLLRFFFFSLSL